ncbi:MAG: efflux RND transporter periplasmic adaptor subunit, partial [Actinomycetia bacterium]|nr:efflux RND transporter periplasmic adaptor subunit [Actinomycetes bacterium]
DSNHIAVQMAEINTEISEKSAQSALISLENANKYLSAIKQHITTPSYQKQQAASSVDTAESGYDQSLLSQSTTYWSNLSSQQAAEAQIAITAKNIEQAEIQLRLAGINYELLGLDSDSHIILAPYDGIVISSAYKTGELAGPGVPAVNIASSEFVIRAAVNETDIVNMEIGQEVIITLDAYYNKILKGEILDMSPVSSNIGGVVSYIVTAELQDSSDIKLFHGLSASMEITTSFLEDVLYVPIESVFEENGKESIDLVVGEDLYERVEVETGLFNYDLIEIKSGLKEGDIIVVSGLE